MQQNLQHRNVCILLLILQCVVFSTGISLSPVMFMSSKTPYYPQQHYASYEVMPPQCKLVHINHMARHGSRHSTKLKAAFALYDVLADALRLQKLTTTGFEALTWTARFIEAETANIGRLTHDGKVEHMEIAERLWRAHGPALMSALRRGRRIVFEATHKSRALGSQEAFLHGFADAALAVYPNATGVWPANSATAAEAEAVPSSVPAADAGGDVAAAFQMHDAKALADILQRLSNDYFGMMHAVHSDSIVDEDEDDEVDDDVTSPSHVHVVQPPECASSSMSAEASHHYAKLRFFDTCAAYARYKKDKNWLQSLEPYTANSTRPHSHENMFLRQIFLEDHVLHLAEMGAARRDKKKPRASKGVDAKKAAKARGRGMPADIVSDIYSICQIQANAYGIFDQFCGLFNQHLNLMSKNELLYDLHDYYKQGAGDATAFAMSCVLLEDFLTAADEGAGLVDVPQAADPGSTSADQQSATKFSADGGQESVPAHTHKGKKLHGSKMTAQQRSATAKPLDVSASARKARRGEFAHFRFGHSETVMPFISMLGLYQEPQAPSLHDYYRSRLARGTAQLLDSTYRRLKALEEREGNAEKPESVQPVTDLLVTNTSFSSLHPRKRAVPFDGQMMVQLKHPWSGARLIPMAANIQWLLYDCGDYNVTSPDAMYGLWVKMLHNEREVQFPACTHMAKSAAPSPQMAEVHKASYNTFASPYGLDFPCPWEVVKKYYRDVVYEQHGITTCDANDWIRICGGVDMNACEQATDD